VDACRWVGRGRVEGAFLAAEHFLEGVAFPPEASRGEEGGAVLVDPCIPI
jgi:hypothetical protein